MAWDILQKRTDENHVIHLKENVEHLKLYGITAERHSIRRDIDDILILLNNEMDIDLNEEGIEDRALLGYEVEYDAVRHGYKVSRYPYNFEELRLLTEYVRASKFISKSQEGHLLAAIESLCRDYQIEELQKEVCLVGRSKTTMSGRSENAFLPLFFLHFYETFKGAMKWNMMRHSMVANQNSNIS